ncbi:hypothetical protein [Phenylobacterium sp.]|jgi:lipopolysaccharide export system protein LptC
MSLSGAQVSATAGEAIKANNKDRAGNFISRVQTTHGLEATAPPL